METLPVITRHAQARIAQTLCEFISFQEVFEAIAKHGNFQVGQTSVMVKHLALPVSFLDELGLRRHGDLVLAVVDKRGDADQGRVCTVMLRESRYADRSFRKHADIPENHSVHVIP